MIAVVRPGRSAGAIGGEVRPRPTRRELEVWLVASCGISKAKASRIAKAVVHSADPFEAAVARIAAFGDLSGRLGYADPTGETAARRVDDGRRAA